LRTRALVFVISLALTGSFSCDTPASVAKFASSAVTTLGTGDSFFDDMKASCVRELQTRESFGIFAVSDPDSSECDAIGKQADGLKAASKLLSSYFTALNDLASFGSTKADNGAKDLASKASGEAKLSAPVQGALGSVASFLTGVATSGYQQKKLADGVVGVHGDVKAVLDGLGEAVGVVYLQELQDEEKKTATRYREFMLAHQTEGGVVIALDSRWQTDRATLSSKEKAAQSYQSALGTLAKGNEDLAAHARDLKAKELPGLLSPYATQLESVVPAILKAFR
jgi:hypothetical protein